MSKVKFLCFVSVLCLKLVKIKLYRNQSTPLVKKSFTSLKISLAEPDEDELTSSNTAKNIYIHGLKTLLPIWITLLFILVSLSSCGHLRNYAISIIGTGSRGPGESQDFMSASFNNDEMC